MLSARLRSIGFPSETQSLKLECLSLAYLAYYSTAGISSRSAESYRRAFNIASFTSYDRSEAGTPAFLLAGFGPFGQDRYTVAIEGTTQLSQLLNWRDSVSTSISPGHPGRVYATFFTHAVNVAARLMADVAFADLWANSSAPIIFTGHSLGAAVAQLLAYRFAALNPNRTIKYMKFGSPKVCNVPVTGTALDDRLRLGSMRHVIDPIGELPVFAPGLDSLRLPGLDLNGGRMVYELGEGMGHDWNVNRLGITERAARLRLADIQFLAQPADTLNPFYYHFMRYYRLRAIELANEISPMMLARLKFLEHNDENSFGHNWIRGEGLQDLQFVSDSEYAAEFTGNLPAAELSAENLTTVTAPPTPQPRPTLAWPRVQNQFSGQLPPSRRRR